MHTAPTAALLTEAASTRLQRVGRALFAGFVLLATVLAPTTWHAGARADAARALHRIAWRGLPAHALGFALLAVALARLIAAGAADYGLSHVAPAVSLRVVLVELAPLYAVLFVAWGLTPTSNAEPAPAALGQALAVWVLAVVGVALALPLCFLAQHGFNAWAWPGYAQQLATVLTPLAGLGLLLKTGAFALAVAIAPAMSAPAMAGDTAAQRHVAALARLLAAVLAIELLALALLER